MSVKIPYQTKERKTLKKARKGLCEAIRYQAKQEEKARKEEKEKKMAEHAAKKENKKMEKRTKKTKAGCCGFKLLGENWGWLSGLNGLGQRYFSRDFL